MLNVGSPLLCPIALWVSFPVTSELTITKGTTCKLDSSSTSSSSPWIAAWMPGPALNSTDESYTIAQHDFVSYRQFTFDLTAASLSSDSNPFISSGSSPSGGSGSSGSSSSSSSSSPTLAIHFDKAHGTIMGTTVVLLFPLGAIFMRLGGKAWSHGLFQIFNLCLLLAGFGLGIKLAKLRYYVCPLSLEHSYLPHYFSISQMILHSSLPRLWLEMG